MPTLNQLAKGHRIKKIYKDKRPDLRGCPQKKGTCWKVDNMTPRKPNSALRKIARCIVMRSKRKLFAYIPGIGHKLQKFSNVLIRGGRVKDLPGMKYTIIRGKFDLRPVATRRTALSKYGGKRIIKRADHRYKKFYYY